MSSVPQQSDQIGPLMDEFVERYRRGERPSVAEYAERHPELADEIRELFPALVMMERVGSEDDGFGDTVRNVTPDGRALERLGDYLIIREIGRGGMGIVYEAEQESLGRRVAIKVLPHYSLIDPKHLKRFQREARAAAQLHHTNIVPVFGVGELRRKLAGPKTTQAEPQDVPPLGASVASRFLSGAMQCQLQFLCSCSGVELME